jgi:Domain of unknown function (DUF4123)
MTKNRVEAQPSSREQLEKFAAHGFLYAILDATDAPLVPAKATELGADRSASLFAETPMQEAWKYAPYLVKVDSATLKWIEQTLWPTPWGVFVVSNCDLATVSSELRKLVRVRLKMGEECIFRYYDPRVLTAFLTGCTADESAAFFAQVRAYAVNDKDALKLFVRNAA